MKFRHRMNPKKCAFGVSAGQFLGFLVHERGIEIGLKSQEAVKIMAPPTTKKELQQLIGKINFVRRFISNLSGRIEPFMELVKIKANDEFRWGAEQQQAFEEIKEYLSKPPVLVLPQQGKPFYVYLSVGDTSIASVIKQVQDGKERVVFYLSRRMLDALKLRDYAFIYSLPVRSSITSCFLLRQLSSANLILSSICYRPRC
jgi:hypothetical protein